MQNLWKITEIRCHSRSSPMKLWNDAVSFTSENSSGLLGYSTDSHFLNMGALLFLTTIILKPIQHDLVQVLLVIGYSFLLRQHTCELSIENRPQGPNLLLQTAVHHWLTNPAESDCRTVFTVNASLGMQQPANMVVASDTQLILSDHTTCFYLRQTMQLRLWKWQGQLQWSC